MAEIEKSDSSQILGLGKTPAQWVEIMAEREIEISERTLRERANDTGAFYRLGRTMLITPAQIDTIFERGPSCRQKSISGADTTMSIQYLSAHPAGRHGFFTELVVRQGVDPVTAAKAGRWSDPNLPMRIYAHAETDEADVRARFRTNHVQEDPVQTRKQQKSKKE